MWSAGRPGTRCAGWTSELHALACARPRAAQQPSSPAAQQPSSPAAQPAEPLQLVRPPAGAWPAAPGRPAGSRPPPAARPGPPAGSGAPPSRAAGRQGRQHSGARPAAVQQHLPGRPRSRRRHRLGPEARICRQRRAGKGAAARGCVLRAQQRHVNSAGPARPTCSSFALGLRGLPSSAVPEVTVTQGLWEPEGWLPPDEGAA